MLLAEDLALLLLDDDRGTFVLDAAHRGPALAGAVLAELVLAGRVGPRSGQAVGPKAPLVVLDPSPTADPVLDAALAVLAERAPAPPERLLGPLAKGLERRLLERLVAAGALREERARLLGLLPVVRHPSADAAPEQAVRTRLASALRTGRAPDARTGALVALLSVTATLAKVQRPEEVGMSHRELVDAGRRVAADDRVAGAVKRVLDGINAAVMAATTTAVLAATTASS